MLSEVTSRQIDTTAVVQSTAFQLALFEAVYEGGSWNLTTGGFQAAGFWRDDGLSAKKAQSINNTARRFLRDAKNYTGPDIWNLTYLESNNDPQSQALVTASLTPLTAVPLPAGGLLLLTAFGGLAGLRRYRKG